MREAGTEQWLQYEWETNYDVGVGVVGSSGLRFLAF